jgi:hypothetical protein
MLLVHAVLGQPLPQLIQLSLRQSAFKGIAKKERIIPVGIKQLLADSFQRRLQLC